MSGTEGRPLYAGENDRGNIFVKTDHGPDVPNQNTYEYYNRDGTRYSSNPDGSRDFSGPEFSHHWPAEQEASDNTASSNAEGK